MYQKLVLIKRWNLYEDYRLMKKCDLTPLMTGSNEYAIRISCWSANNIVDQASVM